MLTPYCLLANNIAMAMLKDTPENVDCLTWRQGWENISEKDYTIGTIHCLNHDHYSADIVFHNGLVNGAITTLFKSVSLHEFVSYMAVRRALEKSHTDLRAQTYLRRNGTELECVVPAGYCFDNGFTHDDWLFPADMFMVKDNHLFFHSPIIKGWARIIYT